MQCVRHVEVHIHAECSPCGGTHVDAVCSPCGGTHTCRVFAMWRYTCGCSVFTMWRYTYMQCVRHVEVHMWMLWTLSIPTLNGTWKHVRLGGCRITEWVLPYFTMVTVPHKMVELERMLDYGYFTTVHKVHARCCNYRQTSGAKHSRFYHPLRH